VVAEGVETKAQFDFLEPLGCELYQGYLFSKPMPALEFEDALA
jgi:EAL domain-containing protein (putative c-di-GMP-specific phosphodiesterase class I)